MKIVALFIVALALCGCAPSRTVAHSESDTPNWTNSGHTQTSSETTADQNGVKSTHTDTTSTNGK